MNVMLRSDNQPDVAIQQATWECCNLALLEQHIRTLQAARKWLLEEAHRRKEAARPKAGTK